MSNNNFSHRFPEVQFRVTKHKETAADKIYLGLFLALCLFFSVIFGNLLFTLMVIILSAIIMLSYSSGKDSVCVLGKEGVNFEGQFYFWEDLKYFSIVQNQIDGNKEYIRLSFRNYLNPNTYVPLPQNVQKETIYAILSSHLEESPNANLSLAEMSMLRFFKW